MDLWPAFIIGLVGSLHCAGMCGPLALALPSAGSSASAYLTGRLAYNLGRMLTYCALGIIFGLFGKALVLAGVQRWVSIGLGIVLLAGLFTSRRLALWRPVTALVNRLKGGMSAMLRRRSATGAPAARRIEWIIALRIGVCRLRRSHDNGRTSGRCGLHGRLRRRNHSNDARDWSFGKTCAVFTSIETREGHSGFRVPVGRAPDSTRHVTRNSLRQPRSLPRFLLQPVS